MLSDHFSASEFFFSQTASRLGLSNTFVVDQHYQNAIILCRDYLEPVRAKLGCPIRISSGYRTAHVNAKVGGSKHSSHMTGCAVDIVPVRGGLKELWLTIQLCVQDKSIPKFDQLIWEFGSWVHLGIRRAEPRMELLRASYKHGRVAYEAYA